MVNYDTVLIRYGELSTKGKNRKDFSIKQNLFIFLDKIAYLVNYYSFFGF